MNYDLKYIYIYNFVIRFTLSTDSDHPLPQFVRISEVFLHKERGNKCEE